MPADLSRTPPLRKQAGNPAPAARGCFRRVGGDRGHAKQLPRDVQRNSCFFFEDLDAPTSRAAALMLPPHSRSSTNHELSWRVGDVASILGFVGGFYTDGKYAYVCEARPSGAVGSTPIVREMSFDETGAPYPFFYANNNSMHPRSASRFDAPQQGYQYDPVDGWVERPPGSDHPPRRTTRRSCTLVTNVQLVRVAGQDVAASTVGRLAHQILNLNTGLRELDSAIEERVRRHRHAEVESMPGLGPLLGAQFLADTGGGASVFGTADRLSGISGLAPVPHGSSRVSGNLRRPRRYDHRLLRAFYLSVRPSIRHNDQSKVFYNRKEPRENVIHGQFLRWRDVG